MTSKLLKYIAAIFVTCFLSANANAATVMLDVLDDNILVGENFDVNVYAQAESVIGDLTSFGFNVINPTEAVFSYTSATLDPADWFDFSSGDYVGGSYTGTSGNAGQNILLAMLSFSAGPDAGTGILNILGIYNEFYLGLFYELDDPLVGQDIMASIPITINTPLPEPLLLISTGFLGILVFRRKTRYN